MKKTNKTLKTLALIIAFALAFASLTACKKDPVKSSSTSDSSKTATTVSSEETLSSETDVSSEETATQSSEPESSTEAPTTSTPAASKPTTTTSSTTSTPSTTTKPSTTPSAPSTPSVPSTPEAPAKKTPQELVIGKWKGQFDFGPAFAEIGYNIGDDSVVEVGMEFTTSGSYITTMDSQSFNRLLKPALQQEFENDRIASGMTPEDYEQAFLDSNGMTVNEYIEYVLSVYNQGWNSITEYKFAADTLLVKDPDSGSFIECEYEFTDDNTLITIEDGTRTTYTRVS